MRFAEAQRLEPQHHAQQIAHLPLQANPQMTYFLSPSIADSSYSNSRGIRTPVQVRES